MTYLGQINGFCVNLVVRLVGSNELHVDQLHMVCDGHNQPVVVALDVEYDPAIFKNACIAVLLFDFRLLLPLRMTGLFKPGFECLLSVSVQWLSPKLFQGGYSNHSHGRRLQSQFWTVHYKGSQLVWQMCVCIKAVTPLWLARTSFACCYLLH